MTRPRRPLSNSASTASWSMRFSLRMMISGALRSMSRFNRLLRLMTRRYRSFRSEVANRPPSSGTSGRSSGGMTGMTSRIIHSGWLPDFRKASMTLSRLTIFFRFCTDVSPSICPEVTRQRVEVHVAQQLPDRLGAHPDLERVGPVLLLELAGLVDRDEILLLRGRDLGVEDHVFLEVEDLLQLAQGHVQQLADAAREPLEEPDVGDGRGELDVPHPLPAHAGAGHLDAAFVAHDTRALHALVLATGALVVLRRAEDPRAEQAVALGLERSVVDGLGLLHLTVRPVTDLLGRGELDPDRVKRDGLRMPIEDAPQILRWLVLSDQAAERPIRQHSVFSSQEAFLPSFMISSTSSARLWSSFTSTLKDSGVPGSRK